MKGSDPNSLLREAGLKINDYEIIYKSDNLERESSAWDYYEYSLKIKGNSTDLLEQLKKNSFHE